MAISEATTTSKQCPIEGCDWTPEYPAEITKAMVAATSAYLDPEAARTNMDIGAALTHYAMAHPLMDWVAEVARLRNEVRQLSSDAMFGL